MPGDSLAETEWDGLATYSPAALGCDGLGGPSLITHRPGDQVKTNLRDAPTLVGLRALVSPERT